ncbi:hypothetical protein [Listeria seeligeri]|uniref:Uncharacterized protein n=1 Tax=Listeria seeligeri FSL N1-067 TaxID=702453 RepID=E3ZTY9_LISSE|nr:hypothetical protein [Listeria seeligeri]EFR98912.1 conserved hypothetical protein [Listeria seeligeri FSL N1-067]
MTINTNLDKIKKYLATEFTTYALLLDGEWGIRFKRVKKENIL